MARFYPFAEKISPGPSDGLAAPRGTCLFFWKSTFRDAFRFTELRRVVDSASPAFILPINPILLFFAMAVKGTTAIRPCFGRTHTILWLAEAMKSRSQRPMLVTASARRTISIATVRICRRRCGCIHAEALHVHSSLVRRLVICPRLCRLPGQPDVECGPCPIESWKAKIDASFRDPTCQKSCHTRDVLDLSRFNANPDRSVPSPLSPGLFV